MKSKSRFLGKLAGLLFIFFCGLLFYHRTNKVVPEFTKAAPLEESTKIEETTSEQDDAKSEEAFEDATKSADHTDTDTDNETTVTVYVCGKVNKPGVYTLPGNPRLADFLREAGGFADGADTDRINLAAYALDGDMLRIPGEEEDAILDAALEHAGVTASDEKTSSSSGKVNINTAVAGELMTIPGIGESKASAIIEYRENNGAFKDTKDIMKIPGIKEGVYAKIKDHICVN